MRTISHIVYHHSSGNLEQTQKEVIDSIDYDHEQRLHPQENGFGYHIAYHYVVFADGGIKETRPLSEIGHHSGNWFMNRKSIGICLQGNFEDETPTEQQIITLQKLISDLRDDFPIDWENVIPHRDVKNTLCAGKNLIAKQEYFKYGQWDQKEDERELMKLGFVTVPKNVAVFDREATYAIMRRMYDSLKKEITP